MSKTPESGNLKRLVGGCFQIGFSGAAVPGETEELVREWGISSFILFRRNYESLPQLIELSRRLWELAAPRAPLLAVDQEGTKVHRFGAPFTVFPDNDHLGRIFPPETAEELAYLCGKTVGEELAAAGVYWNHAPVVDVNTNPANPIIGSRSFASESGLVARLAAAFIKGQQQAGVMATAKHFPGHGDTELDSHCYLPAVHATMRRLEETELPPFRSAAQADAAAIMVAHLLMTEIDDELPASLSPQAYRLLRQELNFEGLAVTDDLEMKAVSEKWGPAQAAAAALCAGADMVLICHDIRRQREALELVYRAALEGDLPVERLREAETRLDRARRRFLATKTPPALEEARGKIGLPPAQELAEIIKALGAPEKVSRRTAAKMLSRLKNLPAETKS